MEKIVEAIFIAVLGDVFATILGVAIDEVVPATEFDLKRGLLILQDLAASRLGVRPHRTYYDLNPLSISYLPLCSRPFIQYLLSCFEQLCLKAQ